MIPSFIIRRFRERKLNDYRPYTKLSAGELLRLRKKLPVRPPIWNPLQLHQKRMLVVGAQTGRFAFHADTGTGKTYTAVALVRYFKKLGRVKQTLVLVPNKTNKAEWARNVKKHSTSTKVCVLTGSSIKKWEQFNATDADLIVETYAGLMRMVSTMVKAKRKNRRKLKWNQTKIKNLCEKVNGLILDESTLVKTKSKLPFRIARQISKRCTIVFALTGTPFGKEPMDLWAQFYLVDGGETLGPTLGLFREVFYSATKGFWGGTTYKFKKKMKSELHRMIANRSISIPADSADLPTVVSVPVLVKLPKDAIEYARSAKDAVIKAHGNYQEMKNAFLRMRQISSGYLGYVDDELGEKVQYHFPTNPKLEALIAKIQEISADKIIVFHEYTASGDTIAAKLKELSIKFVRVYGKTKEPEKLLQQFDEDPKTQVLLLNNAAGGFGLNLQVARYGMVYESPVSPIMRKQVLARFIRQHSKHRTVFLYDYICRGTYDQRILDAIAAGRDLFEAIILGKDQRTKR